MRVVPLCTGSATEAKPTVACDFCLIDQKVFVIRFPLQRGLRGLPEEYLVSEKSPSRSDGILPFTVTFVMPNQAFAK